MASKHPREALFSGEPGFPVIPSCEHFAGSEKLIGKAFGLQEKLGPVFDITMDLEDGAPAGREEDHAQMVVSMARSDANRFRMAGVRIHDHSHPAWKRDIEIIVPGAGDILTYITIPKPTAVAQVSEMIEYIQRVAKVHSIEREIPIHVLIETHGALADAFEIAAQPWVQVLDFGLMDFISGHHGAIGASAMKSPGQFDHALVARGKSRVVAAALAHGVVPAHNVTLDLKSPYQTFADASRARSEFGFLRMWSIHPAQIRPIVDAMQPDFSEVQHGCEILRKASESDWGPIQHAGDLHDRATYRYFWELVQRAHISGQDLPDFASTWMKTV